MLLSEAAEILGLSLPTTRFEAKKAYSALVKSHKPEADPEGFKRVREAWETFEAYFSGESDFPFGSSPFSFDRGASPIPRNAPLTPGDGQPPDLPPRAAPPEAALHTAEPPREEESSPPGAPLDPLWALFAQWTDATRARSKGPREEAYARLDSAFSDEEGSRAMSASDIHAWRIAREAHGLWSELLDAEVEYCLSIVEWAYRSTSYADMPDIPESILNSWTKKLIAAEAQTLMTDYRNGINARVMALASRGLIADPPPAPHREPSKESTFKATVKAVLLVFVILIGFFIALSRAPSGSGAGSGAGTGFQAFQNPPSPPFKSTWPPGEAELKNGLDSAQFDAFVLNDLQKAWAKGDQKEAAAIRLRFFEKVYKKKLKYDSRGMIGEAKENGEDKHGNDTGN